MDFDFGTREPRRTSAPEISDFATSIASDKHTDWNEDCFLIEVDKGVAAVFDGVGGAAAGENASRIGRQACEDKLDLLGEWGEHWPEWVLYYGRGKLEEAAQAAGNGMTTTAVVVAVVGENIEIAWCGDSRAFGVGQQGVVRKLTEDHSTEDALRRNGRLSEVRAKELGEIVDEVESAEEAFKLGGSLARDAFLGRFRIRAALSEGEISRVTVGKEEWAGVLLTSDGVHDNLTRERLGEVVGEALRKGPERVAAAVVAAAKAYTEAGTERAKTDDITAVFLPIR